MNYANVGEMAVFLFKYIELYLRIDVFLFHYIVDSVINVMLTKYSLIPHF